MKAIRTRTVTYYVRRYCFIIIWVLMLALAATTVFAQKPPNALFKMVTQTAQLVHRGDCNVPQRKLRDVTCLIFYDKKRVILYLVLFAEKNSAPYVTNVMAVHNDIVTDLWIYPQHAS